jgi:predicted transcriptional regulator
VTTVSRGRNKHIYLNKTTEKRKRTVIGIIRASEYLFLPFLVKKLRLQGYNVEVRVYNEGLTLTRHIAEGIIDMGYSPLITQLLYYRFIPTYRIIYGGVYGGAGILSNPKAVSDKGGSTPISTMETCIKSYDSNIDVTYYYSGEEILDALSRGKIKIGAVWEPYLSYGIKSGYKLEARCSDLIAPYCCTLAVNKEFLEEEARLRAIVESSLEDYSKNPLRMASWYARLTRTPLSLLKRVYGSYIVSGNVERNEVSRMLNKVGMRLPSPSMLLEAIED